MNRQLPCGYIYCVVPSSIKVGKKHIANEYKDGKCIVKVGKSNMLNFHYRMRSYGHNHIILGVHFSPMFDSMETWLIETFKREYGDPVYGAEYFLANPNCALAVFTKFIANRPEEDLKIEKTIDYGWLMSTKKHVKIIKDVAQAEQKAGWIQSAYGFLAAKLSSIEVFKPKPPPPNEKKITPDQQKDDDDDDNLLKLVLDTSANN